MQHKRLLKTSISVPPLDTIVQSYSLPTIRAAIAVRRNDSNQALELLKMTSPIELGDSGNLLPVYVRGQIYLELRDGRSAAAEFQKFIEYLTGRKLQY